MGIDEELAKQGYEPGRSGLTVFIEDYLGGRGTLIDLCAPKPYNMSNSDLYDRT